jgi:hypothetical protein
LAATPDLKKLALELFELILLFRQLDPQIDGLSVVQQTG